MIDCLPALASELELEFVAAVTNVASSSSATQTVFTTTTFKENPQWQPHLATLERSSWSFLKRSVCVLVTIPTRLF